MKKNKLLRIFLWTGLVFILLISVGLYYLFNVNNYQLEGELQVKGLQSPVKIYRDEKGMPYIYAENYRDLIFAQGFITAQDRLFQMQLTRMYAEGRLTELAGDKARAVDIRMRTLGFARNAKEHVKILDKETKEFLQAYADGVNAFIEQNEDIPVEFSLAGIKAEKWTIESSIAIMYYMGWGSGSNLKTEMLSLLLIEKVGFEKFKTIYPINTNLDSPSSKVDSLAFEEFVDTTQRQSFNFLPNAQNLLAYAEKTQLQWGSNNWTVDGSRSASGKPMMASDPHLDSRILPGIMHPVGLFLKNEIRAVGVTIPGVPALLIGRSQYLSNGITNAYLDIQDLFIETIDPENNKNYLEGDSSIAFEIVEETLKIKDENSEGGFFEEKIEIRKTNRGVVISGIYPEFETDKTLTLRYAPYEQMNKKIGIDFLLKAKNIKDAKKYLREVSMIANNFTIADTEGNIACYLVGRVPKRKAGTGRIPYQVKGSESTWIGWIPYDSLPHRIGSEEGWLGNANHNIIPADYPFYISNYFSPYYRYAVLRDLMKSKKKFTVDDHWRFQRNDYNVIAKKLTPIFVKALEKDEETEPLAEELRKWNFKQDINSVGASIFQNVYRILPRLIYQDELGEELTLEMLGTWYFWQERVEQMILKGESEWFDDIKTEATKESLEMLIIKAGKETHLELSSFLGNDISQWQWGKIHTISYVNPIRREGWGKVWLGSETLPMGGSGETLHRSLYDYNQPEEIAFSACLRMVADLGDEEKVLAVINGGVTARTFHPFQSNQIEAYLSGEKRYWWFSDAKIKENAKYVLELKP